jgi:ribosome-associated protein
MGRRTDRDHFPDQRTEHEGTPSKSARKRAATAGQELGERLVGMSEAELAALPLPEVLREAIRVARGLRSRGSQARQRQYIGRIMREVDVAPILQQLEAGTRAQTLDSAHLRRIEGWRDRLIAEGDDGLTALGELCPLTADRRAKLSIVLHEAQGGVSEPRRTATRRALFRELRTLLPEDAGR